MERSRNLEKLSSLTDWSKQHIKEVFEAPSDVDAIKAIAKTFSPKLEATINGKAITRDDITQLVLAMRQGSSGGLHVHWQNAVEVPRDPATNREGSFGGVYIIHGIQKILPGYGRPVEFERHKTVTVRIESQSLDHNVDSRRIVNLVFVASDVRAHRQAAL